MENFSKNLSCKNTSLNVDFYKTFYSLEGDEKVIREHFNTHGKVRHLIPNEEVLSEVLARVLNFQDEVYMSNQSIHLNGSLIKDNHHCHDKGYYISHLYGKHQVSKGQLEHSHLVRVINSQELFNYKHKWNVLHAKLFKHFKFDMDYYTFFHKIDCSNVFEHWLAKDIFDKKHPNLKSFQKDVNLMTEMVNVLHKLGVDLNYISSEYHAELVSKQIAIPATLTGLEIPVYILFNHAKQYGFFWSKEERDEYIKAHIEPFNKANEYLKSQQHYDEKTLNEIADKYEQEFRVMVKQHEDHQFEAQPIKMELKSIVGSIRFLKKVTNKWYIENFKKLNNVPDDEVLQTLLQTVLHNVVKVKDATEFLSMDLKEFVISFFYNTLLHLKQGKTKEEYLELVKQNMHAFLVGFFQKVALEYDAGSLMKDIEFLIENKKIIKFTKLTVQLISLLM